MFADFATTLLLRPETAYSEDDNINGLNIVVDR